MFKILNTCLTIICLTFSLNLYAATSATINVLKDNELKQSGVAALVSNELLLVNYLLVSQGDQIQIKDNKTGAIFVGNIIGSDKDADLALISVKGFQGSPVTLAEEAPEAGRKVILVVNNGASREGTLHSLLESDDKHPHPRVQHTIPVKDGEYGSPLLNNCSQLIGVSQNKKNFFTLKLKPSSTLSIASSLKILKSFLTANDVSYKTANESCLSEKEKVKILEQEKEQEKEAKNKAEEERKKAEEEKINNEKKVEDLKKQKDKANKELEKAKKDKKKKAIELEKEKSKTAEQKEALEKAEKDNLKQKEALEKAEKEKIEKEKLDKEKKKLEEEKQKEERKKQIYLAGALALAFLIFLIIVWWLFRRRRNQLRKAEQDASSKKHQLNVEKAKYEASQAELEQASATFNDIVIAGKDEDGQELRIKIIGNTLARSSDGVLVGRSAQKVNYVINVPGVSREHLRLTLIDNKVTAQDLGSANGTAINSKEISGNDTAVINNNDEIRIGTFSGIIYFLDE